MALKEWIRTTGEKIRDAVEQAFPMPKQQERVPIRIPIPVNPPRAQRRYY